MLHNYKHFHLCTAAMTETETESLGRRLPLRLPLKVWSRILTTLSIIISVGGRKAYSYDIVPLPP